MAIEFYLRHSNKNKSKADQLLLEESEIQNLLSPYSSSISKELDVWMNTPYEKNLKYPEYLVHKVSKNVYVRSKSEGMIGKLLYMNKIPFRYECKLILDDVAVSPDFTIRHPKTGEYFYWEHFGLMDNSDYVKNTCSKIQIYTENGIISSVNLITTYETKENPLSFEMVEMLVNYYFF